MIDLLLIFKLTLLWALGFMVRTIGSSLINNVPWLLFLWLTMAAVTDDRGPLTTAIGRPKMSQGSHQRWVRGVLWMR